MKPSSSRMRSLSPSKINFLDVTVSLHNNNIVTDLHVKSTDAHQYLLSSSCHPNHIKKSNPHSLALRIRRISSTNDILNNALMNFWIFFANVVTKDTTSKHKSTQLSMSHVKKHSLLLPTNNCTVFVSTYNPSLPILSLKHIILSLRPLIAAKMLLEIHLFLSAIALATFAMLS